MNQIESKSGMGNLEALIAFKAICPEHWTLPMQNSEYKALKQESNA